MSSKHPPNPKNSATSSATSRERRDAALNRRAKAAGLADRRPIQITLTNKEFETYHTAPTSFHKGLPHTLYGQPLREHLEIFASELALTSNAPAFARFDVPLGPVGTKGSNRQNWPDPVVGSQQDQEQALATTFYTAKNEDDELPSVRDWESPLAGHAYDLEGPDAGDMAMAPVPGLNSSEFCAEMAEVYAMALLRDVPFAKFGAKEPIDHIDVAEDGNLLPKKRSPCVLAVAA